MREQSECKQDLRRARNLDTALGFSANLPSCTTRRSHSHMDMSGASGPNSTGSSPCLKASTHTTGFTASTSFLLKRSTTKLARVPRANLFDVPSGPQTSTHCTPKHSAATLNQRGTRSWHSSPSFSCPKKRFNPWGHTIF